MGSLMQLQGHDTTRQANGLRSRGRAASAPAATIPQSSIQKRLRPSKACARRQEGREHASHCPGAPRRRGRRAPRSKTSETHPRRGDSPIHARLRSHRAPAKIRSLDPRCRPRGRSQPRSHFLSGQHSAPRACWLCPSRELMPYAPAFTGSTAAAARPTWPHPLASSGRHRASGLAADCAHLGSCRHPRFHLRLAQARCSSTEQLRGLPSGAMRSVPRIEGALRSRRSRSSCAMRTGVFDWDKVACEAGDNSSATRRVQSRALGCGFAPCCCEAPGRARFILGSPGSVRRRASSGHHGQNEGGLHLAGTFTATPCCLQTTRPGSIRRPVHHHGHTRINPA